jgi:hypothetical protein
MSHRFLLAFALLPLLAAPVTAAQPAPPVVAARGAPAGPGAHPPAPPAAQPPAPAPTAGPRRPRPYAQCKATAIQRRMRGAERRHYITRCQLGYGRPLFRRRGPIPAAAPAPAPNAPPAAGPAGANGPT